MSSILLTLEQHQLGRLRRTAGAAWRIAAAGIARLRALRPEWWLMVGLGLLLVLFVLVLLFEPTAGRGGR
jgi:uncharacterized membrane protein HdeD (DUF308 family)